MSGEPSFSRALWEHVGGPMVIHWDDGTTSTEYVEPIPLPEVFPSQATASHLAWKHPLIDG